MLKTLIVDDEHLVRKGIRYGVRWHEYGIEVVAEAESVAEAIKVLTERRDIDLVFTDLMMPGANGTDLLRHLKDHYPFITAVVLTYIDDFYHLQEALRLNAADYIVKTELDSGDMDEILRRVSTRAQRVQENQHPGIGAAIMPDSALVLCDLAQRPVHIPPALCDCPMQRALRPDAVLFAAESALDAHQLTLIERALAPNTVILTFEGDAALGVPQWTLAVDAFITSELFYRYLPNLRHYTLSAKTALAPKPILSRLEYAHLQEALLSLRWVHDRDALEAITEGIARARLPQQLIYPLFYDVQKQWSRCFADGDTPNMFPMSDLKYWYQWVDWMNNFRTFVSAQRNFHLFSNDIVAGIQRLIIWLSDHFYQDITLEEAAHRIHLSYSYLSRSFKAVTGKSFNAYVRDLRIAYAKQMLAQTQLPVYRIAEMSGFSNPFHFNKTFKKHVGTTPGEFRKTFDH